MVGRLQPVVRQLGLENCGKPQSSQPTTTKANVQTISLNVADSGDAEPGVGPVAPAAWGVGWRITPDIGWLFLATAVAYYLSYELLHLGAHLPVQNRWGRARVVRWVRAHHAVHHDPRRMRHEAFNITVPLWDAVLGTVASRDDAADSARHGVEP